MKVVNLFSGALDVHSVGIEGHESLPVVPVGLGVRVHGFTASIGVGEIEGGDDESLQSKYQSSDRNSRGKGKTHDDSLDLDFSETHACAWETGDTPAEVRICHILVHRLVQPPVGVPGLGVRVDVGVEVGIVDGVSQEFTLANLRNEVKELGCI